MVRLGGVPFVLKGLETLTVFSTSFIKWVLFGALHRRGKCKKKKNYVLMQNH